MEAGSTHFSLSACPNDLFSAFTILVIQVFLCSSSFELPLDMLWEIWRLFLAQFCTKQELSEHVLCDDVFAILNSLRDWGDYSIYPFNKTVLLINLDLP